MSRIYPTSVSCAAALVFPTLVVSTVLGSQVLHPSLLVLGRIANVVALFLALILISQVVGKTRVTILIAGMASLWFVKQLFELDEPYLFVFSAVMFVAGIVVGRTETWVKRTRKFVFWIAVSCSILMTLQVLGVGAWTQTLTTHGIIADGTTVSHVPHPTLLVAKDDLLANFLQGRPAGFLHANQFACLMVIVTIGFGYRSLFQHRSRALLYAAIPFSILSLAKVSFLGFASMWVAGMLLRRDFRKVLMEMMALFVLSFIAYWMVFPGVVDTYLLGSYALWGTLYGRIFEVMKQLPFEASHFLALGEYSGQQIGHDQTRQLMFGKGGQTGLVQILKNPVLSGIVVCLVIGGFVLLRRTVSVRIEPWSSCLVAFVGLLIFAMAAPAFAWPVYWLYVGFVIAPMFSLGGEFPGLTLFKSAKKLPA